MSDPTSGARCAAPGGLIWYDILNPDAPGTPVVTVHGGPGTPHDYLRPLADTLPGHPVVVYDQSGCGRSTARPGDARTLRLEHFVDELDALVTSLDLRRFHLLGHSFGTMIACDFALRGTHRPDWLILVSPVLNVRKYEEDMRQLLFRLPPETARAISEALRTDRYDTAAYREAALVFAERHMCRVAWPDELVDATLGTVTRVRDALWGPTEFRVTGDLRTYTRSAQLPRLDVPTLFLSGEHDFVPARACQAYARAVPHGRTAVVPGASHMPHLERPELFAKELLTRIGGPG